MVLVEEGPTGFPTEEAVSELKSLCLTAGFPANEVERVVVREPNPATFLGKGKVWEIAERIKETGVNLAVLNLDLSGVQHRNLNKAWGVEIIDRTSLILQIFSKHAHSAAGKLQVDLARANYFLSRLTGRGVLLSRLGGGIGTRGPGEMKLEEERRKIRERIQRIENRIANLKGQWHRTRALRQSRGLPEIALVGYTNAGKSALLNALCGKEATLVADKLFATLDTTTRRIYFGENRIAVVTDTVGFIHNLPHSLVAAFHATLEGIASAQLIALVLDGSSPLIEKHLQTAREVLKEISADNIPTIQVINKIDLLTPEQMDRLARKFPEASFVSALTHQGLDQLKEKVAAKVWTNQNS